MYACLRFRESGSRNRRPSLKPATIVCGFTSPSEQFRSLTQEEHFVFTQLQKFAVRFLAQEDGPTAVEYAVMLALIIVVCIAAITTLGGTPLTTSRGGAPTRAWSPAGQPRACTCRPRTTHWDAPVRRSSF